VYFMQMAVWGIGKQLKIKNSKSVRRQTADGRRQTWY